MNRTAPHLAWGAHELWQELVPLLPGVSVEVLPRLDSTNSRLLERARAIGGDDTAPVTRPGELDNLQHAERTPHGRRAGDCLPCLLVAEQQTRGRGRLGRGWVSEVGASLTFSLSMPLAPRQWGGLSLAVGLAMAEALDPQPLASPVPLADGRQPQRPRLALKWPNDLWLWEGPGRGRKLGGVLIETVAVGARRMCVVGVGINVLPLAEPLAQGLDHGYACWQEIEPGATAPAALERVAVPLVQALQRFESEGFAPLVPAFARRDLLRGQRVTATAPEALRGVAEGVDAQGALLLRTEDDGREAHRVISGEVSIRLGAD